MNTKAMTQTKKTYHDAIAALARELWDKGGRQSNHDLKYWLEAERQVLAQSQSKPVGGARSEKRGAQATRAATKPTQASRRGSKSAPSKQGRASVM